MEKYVTMVKMNPFITSGYRSEKYFCDRIEETRFLTKQITNGNNVALISPRRLGKTGLIEHCFPPAGSKKQLLHFPDRHLRYQESARICL